MFGERKKRRREKRKGRRYFFSNKQISLLNFDWPNLGHVSMPYQCTQRIPRTQSVAGEIKLL